MMDTNEEPAMIETAEATEQKSPIRREAPNPPQQRQAYITHWCSTIKSAKKFWEPDFKRMRNDMDFVFYGASKDWVNAEKYVANIVQRFLRQQVAALYARNPQFVCKRRERMDFEVWDEKPESLQNIQMLAQAQPDNPAMMLMLQDLMKDIENGTLHRQKMNKICKTMELVFADSVKEQSPNFKKQMKQLVRRTLTTGVGWAKIDFQRVMKPRADEETNVNDITHRFAHLQRLEADKIDGKIEDGHADQEELDQAKLQLTREPEIIVREGLIFSFPKSTAIIPDTRTRSLESLQGADWVAEEFLMDVDEIKEIHKVDIGTGFKGYTIKGDEDFTQLDMFSNNMTKTYAKVWHVYNKKAGTRFVIADGYNDYLEAPNTPPVVLESFFPYLPLMFNEIEHDRHIFPLSDVFQIRHIQVEYNRAKEALRQHRIAAKPLYATAAGAFEEEDQMNLAFHDDHDVIILKGLKEGENVNNKLQQVEKKAIDPNVYETESVFQDLTRVVGAQEAHFGSVKKATATEVSVGEDSRNSALSDSTDDLDEFLSEMARLGGQVLLMEMSVEEVKKRVGPGAIWPELSRAEIMQEVYMTIEAGSSGRPNKAAKGAALERVGNILMSLPGVSPRWLFKQLMMTVDETLDLTDAYIEGQPSILMMNRLAATAQTEPGGGPNDPTNQGMEGQNNEIGLDGVDGGPQPAYTAPGTAQNQFVKN